MGSSTRYNQSNQKEFSAQGASIAEAPFFGFMTMKKSEAFAHKAKEPAVVRRLAATARSGRDPYRIKREVEIESVVPGEMVIHQTGSFTREGDDLKYHPTIRLDGLVTCDCGDFRNRCAWATPDVLSHPDFLCKHLIRALLERIYAGDLDTPDAHREVLEVAAYRTRRDGNNYRAVQAARRNWANEEGQAHRAPIGENTKT